ncbi:MAG: hypothetical protein SWK76_17660 [Actinomycetota bacterium]|nr:hypothetical protein [Actinomycetota bacterium]
MTITGVAIEPQLFTPNGDGLTDTRAFSCNITEEAYIDFTVFLQDFKQVARPEEGEFHPAGTVIFSWDGTNTHGDFVEEDNYYLAVFVTTERGKQTIGGDVIQVDNAVPEPLAIFPSAEPNHPDTQTKLEAIVSEEAAEVALTVEGGAIPLTTSGENLWSCELPNQPGTSRAGLMARDAHGNMSITSLNLISPGFAGEYRVIVSDQDDFEKGQVGGIDSKTYPGWFVNSSPGGELNGWVERA